MAALDQVPCTLLNPNGLEYLTMPSTTRTRQHLLSSVSISYPAEQILNGVQGLISCCI